MDVYTQKLSHQCYLKKQSGTKITIDKFRAISWLNIWLCGSAESECTTSTGTFKWLQRHIANTFSNVVSTASTVVICGSCGCGRYSLGTRKPSFSFRRLLIVSTGLLSFT